MVMARMIFNGYDDVITDLYPRIESTRENIIRRMGKALNIGSLSGVSSIPESKDRLFA